MKYYADMVKDIENRKARSAWAKGVKLYALDILENIRAHVDYDGEDMINVRDLERRALNGAEEWSEYSWGGYTLLYNEDIAWRLCTNSELNRTKNGTRRPNSREEWLDVQARALNQAYNMVKESWLKMRTAETGRI